MAKVKELWEHNTSQKDMVRILQELGYEIKDRELMRLRAKNRWLLRVPNGMKGQSTVPAKRGHEDSEAKVQEIAQSMYPDLPQEPVGETEQLPIKATAQRAPSPDLSPEVIAKRKQRLERMKSESDELWASRKRRRRTRGWAGLPADPPGPPRFPSEMTIDEGKQALNLDPEMYRQLREHFQSICEETGVTKKSIAGVELWGAVKDRLVQESPHLQTLFWADTTILGDKSQALDVVCMDVTKRMRTLERRMTIAEAKNALRINPEQSRQIRNAFYNTLKGDHFTSKLEAGEEHWKELKQQWIEGLPILQEILAPGDADPEHATKVKAMEVLCRDVMKRLRDDQTKRDPSRKKVAKDTDVNADASNGSKKSTRGKTNGYGMNNGISNGISTLASQALATAPTFSQATVPHNAYSDLQIDPSLLLAANDPSIGVGHQHLLSHPLAIPVYFRLSPLSPLQTPTKLWLGTLNSTSVHELRYLALDKHEHHTVQVARIEGVVRSEHAAPGQGKEVSFAIDEDDELRAYLNHVEGGKATFVVQLTGLA